MKQNFNLLKQEKKYKDMIKQEKKKYFHSIYSQLEDIDPGDPKELWRTINRIKKGKLETGQSYNFKRMDQLLKNYLKMTVTLRKPWLIHT